MYLIVSKPAEVGGLEVQQLEATPPTRDEEQAGKLDMQICCSVISSFSDFPSSFP
jgi:hypothetical protein